MNADLRNATYDEIVEFVFNHLPEDEVDEKWYWKQLDDDVQIEPRQAIAFLTQLCTSPANLLHRFTLRQIAEGVNFLFGARAQHEFSEQLWNGQIPWPERRRCIQLIPNLYTQVFELDEYGIGGCAFMLWDSIAYGYYCGNRDPGTDAEDARVQDAMFEALVAMLRSDHSETLRGAIHGLGHLQHRESNRAIRNLLSSSRELDPDVRVYAAQVLEGHFQ
jgi:hypothetical protein